MTHPENTMTTTTVIDTAAVASFVAVALDHSVSKAKRNDALISAMLSGLANPAEVLRIKADIEATKTEKKPAGSPREYGITSFIKDMLFITDFSHRDIVSMVKEQFPDAETTVKSVATVAKVMRKQGVSLPTRTVSY
jgi:hypothetical protein